MYRKVHDEEVMECRSNNRNQQQSGAPLSVSPSFTSKSNLSKVDSSSLVGSETSSYSRFSKNYSRSQHSTSVARPYQNIDIDSENVTPVKIRFENYVNRFAAHVPRSSSPTCRRDAQDLQQENLPNRSPSPSMQPRISVSEHVDRFGGKRQTNSPAMHSNNIQDVQNPRIRSTTEFSRDWQYHKSQHNETKKQSREQQKSKQASLAPHNVPYKETTNYSPEQQKLKHSSLESQNIHRIRTGGSTSTATTSTNTSAMQEPKWRHHSSTPDTQKSHTIDSESPPILSKTPPTFVPSAPQSAPAAWRNTSQRARSKSLGRSPKEENESAKVHSLKEKLWDKEEKLQVSVPPSLKYPMEADVREQRRHRFARSLSPDRPQYRSSQFNSRYYMAAIASHRLRRTESVGLVSERPEEEVQQEGHGHQHPPFTRFQQEINDSSQAIRTTRSSENSPALHTSHLPSPKFQQSPSERQRFEKPSPYIDSAHGKENNRSNSSESPAVSMDRLGRTEEPDTVSDLIAKLNAISRSNPAEALAQIDSILNCESGKSPSEDAVVKDSSSSDQIAPIEDRAVEDYPSNSQARGNSSGEESEDDETSVSSITNPSYSGGKMLSSSRGSRLPRPNALENFQSSNMVRNEAQKKLEKLERKNRPPPPDTIKVKENTMKEPDSISNRGKLDQHLQKTATYAGSSAADIAMKIRIWDEMSSSTGKRSGSTAKKSLVSLNDESVAITATTSELGSLITPTQSENNETPRKDPILSPREEPKPELLDYSCGIEDQDFRCDGASFRFKNDEIHGRSNTRYESPKVAQARVPSNPHSKTRQHPWDYDRKQHQPGEYWTETKQLSDQLQLRPNSSGRKLSNKKKKKDERSGNFSDSFDQNNFEMDPELLALNDSFNPRQKAGGDENFAGFSAEFDAAWESLSPNAFDNERRQVKTTKPKPLSFSVRPQQDRQQLSQSLAENSNSNEWGKSTNTEQSELEATQDKGRSKLNLFNPNRGNSKSPGRRNIMQRFNRRKKDVQN